MLKNISIIAAILFLSVSGCLTYLHVQKNRELPIRVESVQKAKKDGLDFKAYYLNQKPFRVSDYLGKVVVINFWATWCGPCVEELPSLNSLAKQYKDEMVVLAISDEQAHKIKNFLMAFPDFYSNFILANKSKTETQEMFGIKTLPETYIVDKKGFLVERVIGPQKWDSKSWIKRVQEIITR